VLAPRGNSLPRVRKYQQCIRYAISGDLSYPFCSCLVSWPYHSIPGTNYCFYCSNTDSLQFFIRQAHRDKTKHYSFFVFSSLFVTPRRSFQNYIQLHINALTALQPPPNYQPVLSLVALSNVRVAAIGDAIDDSDERLTLLQHLDIILHPDVVRRTFEHGRGRTSLEWVHECDEVSAGVDDGAHLVTPRGAEVWWDGDEESVFCILCCSESKECGQRTYSHILDQTCPPSRTQRNRRFRT